MMLTLKHRYPKYSSPRRPLLSLFFRTFKERKHYKIDTLSLHPSQDTSGSERRFYVISDPGINFVSTEYFSGYRAKVEESYTRTLQAKWVPRLKEWNELFFYCFLRVSVQSEEFGIVPGVEGDTFDRAMKGLMELRPVNALEALLDVLRKYEGEAKENLTFQILRRAGNVGSELESYENGTDLTSDTSLNNQTLQQIYKEMNEIFRDAFIVPTDSKGRFIECVDFTRSPSTIFTRTPKGRDITYAELFRSKTKLMDQPLLQPFLDTSQNSEDIDPLLRFIPENCMVYPKHPLSRDSASLGFLIYKWYNESLFNTSAIRFMKIIKTEFTAFDTLRDVFIHPSYLHHPHNNKLPILGSFAIKTFVRLYFINSHQLRSIAEKENYILFNLSIMFISKTNLMEMIILGSSKESVMPQPPRKMPVRNGIPVKKPTARQIENKVYKNYFKRLCGSIFNDLGWKGFFDFMILNVMDIPKQDLEYVQELRMAILKAPTTLDINLHYDTFTELLDFELSNQIKKFLLLPFQHYHQQLEYIGDAVLGLASAQYFYTKKTTFSSFANVELIFLNSNRILKNFMSALFPTLNTKFKGKRFADMLETLVASVFILEGYEKSRELVWRIIEILWIPNWKDQTEDKIFEQLRKKGIKLEEEGWD